MRFKQPTVKTWIAFLSALTLLVSLGIWQLQRLDWKRDLLAGIDSNMLKPAVTLPLEIQESGQWDYRNVVVTGRFLHAREMYLHGIGPNGQPVMRIITPLMREAGDSLLVDRGWAPPDLLESGEPDAIDRPVGQVKISGVARRIASPGLFLPDNRPERNRWFSIHRDAMAQFAGLESLAPVIVIAQHRGGGNSLPRPTGVQIDIPNNHLGYALVWFSLAIVLGAIFILYHVSKPAAGA